MQRQGVSAFVLVVIAVGIFGVLLFVNSRPTPALRVIIPTEMQATEPINSWEAILEAGFGSDSTPLPTVAIPTIDFVPPTLALGSSQPTALSPAELNSGNTVQQFSVAATPTRPPATIAPLLTDIPVTAIAVTRPSTAWQPPPLIPPISRDILGRDHYYFIRPVDSNATNRGLFYYPYGSDGADNSSRVHSGIDMPNDIGQTVRAAGAGLVVWAGPSFQSTFSYGNVVMIEHDFGFEGRRLYTLYAHLSAVLVIAGQYVQPRDPIGLVGNTGSVTGPHVHFEIRLGEENSTEQPTYGDTYNPVLWMVPYVGTGVIAGRVTNANGRLVMDANVTIRNWATGLNADTTTTYIYENTGVDVNSDPSWDENFAVSDLPAGRYEVITTIDGAPVRQLVTVTEGTTTFVELSPSLPPTPETVTAGA